MSEPQDSRSKNGGMGRWWAQRVVDAHGHLGSYEGYDLSLPNLLANIERFGIRMVLVSNIDGAELPETENLDEAAANRQTVETVTEHHDRLRGIAWTRPEDGSAAVVESFLDAHLPNGEPIFTALKFHPEMNHFPADDPRVDPYLDLCARRALPAVFHCDAPGTHSGPERIYALARRHPTVPVVLYHMGFGGHHDAAIEAAAESRRKRDANLFLGTAQADPRAVVRAIRRIGVERVLFGTDATYYGREHYERYIPMVDLLRRELSADELSRVLGGNARRLFRLAA